MSLGRFPACLPDTIFCAGLWIFFGNLGDQLRFGKNLSRPYCDPHLFEAGGENYHVDFSGWNYVRGHEGDLWRTFYDPSWTGSPAMPARPGGWFWSRYGIDTPARGYDMSRSFFRSEEDYPGPQTMMDAERFLRDATPHHDRWFLFVDEFDPHEPFDTPEPWSGMYFDEAWDEEWIIWPPYIDGGISNGVISEKGAILELTMELNSP